MRQLLTVNAVMFDPTVQYVPAPVSSANQATFSRTDIATLGNWKSGYGAEAYNIAGDNSTNNPKPTPNGTVTLTPALIPGSWNSSPQPGSELLLAAANSTARTTQTWYSSTSFSLDVRLTDGNAHQFALYVLDEDSTIRSETIQATDDSSGLVLGSQTISNFSTGKYLVWTVKGNVTFTVTNTNPNSNAVVSGWFLGKATAPGGSATILTPDTTTLGNWKSLYGSEAYNIAGDNSANNPKTTSKGTVTPIPALIEGSWNSPTQDSRELLLAAANSTSRTTRTWYSSTSFSLDVRLTDGKAHQFALYVVDEDSGGRSETIQAIDDSSGTVLNSQTISNFSNGEYLIWTVTGNVTFTMTHVSGSNAVVSGWFLGGATTPLGSASFNRTDITTQGTWKSVYGAKGFEIAQDTSSNNPTLTYAGLTWTNALPATPVWSASTADVRALQKADPAAADRIAGAWYNPDSFSLDVQIHDGQAHQVALYVLDWDRQSRSETISVIDDSTGIVLNSQSASGFENGTYYVWTVTGNVTFKVARAGTANAVLSGVFFG